MKTLSDEIQENGKSSWGDDFIWIEDVKEFIQELKEEFKSAEPITKMLFYNAIDKFAGDKLI